MDPIKFKAKINMLTIAFLLCGLLYYYLTLKQNYWKCRKVPYKKPNLLFGNMYELIFGYDSPGRFFGKLYKKFDGPYFGFFGFSKPWLIVKDPGLVKRILIKDHQFFINRIIMADVRIDPVIGSGLIGIKNPHWKILRTRLSQVFTASRINDMLHFILESSRHFTDYMKAHTDKSVEVQYVAEMYMIDIIASCFFGFAENTFLRANLNFKEAISKLHRGSFMKTASAISYFFAQIFVKILRFEFLDTEAVTILKAICSNSMRQREISKIKRPDLIDILVGLKNTTTKLNGFNNSEDSLTSQAVTFFVGAFESTSAAIAFTLQELSVNIAIQERLRREITDVIDNTDKLSYEAIKKMKYLHMIVSETLRKYPLIPFVSRKCAVDYEIPETGLIIEKGTPVLIPQHGLHSDQKYFPNPGVFDPERFNEINKKTRIDCTYQPFGNGPRNCIGARFALLTIKVAVIHLIRNFRVEMNSQTMEPLGFGRSGILHAEPGVFLTFKNLV